MKEYKDYVKEIEELKEKFNLSASQILMLQIAGAFEVEDYSYEKLKKEFCDLQIYKNDK